MEDNFKQIIIPIILSMVFGYFLYAFVSDVTLDYGADTSNLALINSSTFNSSLNGLSDASNILDAFLRGNIISAIGEIITGGLFDILGSIKNIILSPFIIIQNVLTNVFMFDPFIATILNGVFLLCLAFAIWRFVRVGD